MNRKKRALRILIVCTVMILIILGAGAYVKTTYTVSTVYVEGNVHYTEDEIKNIVMDGFLGDNSLFLSAKYRNKSIQNVPFVDFIDVEVLNSETIKINVIEKMLTGYVSFMDTNMYFDKDGYVVESSSTKTIGVPQISGLKFDHVVVGEPLPVENKEIFDAILNITKLLNKYKLIPDKIYFGTDSEITLYFDEIKVTLGNDNFTMEDKLMRLPKFLEDLEGKKGTLPMAIYDDNGTYVFRPE